MNQSRYIKKSTDYKNRENYIKITHKIATFNDTISSAQKHFSILSQNCNSDKKSFWLQSKTFPYETPISLRVLQMSH